MPINWTPENHHKILLYLLKRIETKNIDVDHLASLFEGATPKALKEHIAKLRREAKLIDDGPENAIVPGGDQTNPVATNTNATTTTTPNDSPTKATSGKPRGRPKKGKDAVENGENGGGVKGKGGKTPGEKGKGGGGKRKRGGAGGVDKGALSDKLVVGAGEVEEGYGGDVEEEVEVKKVKTEVVDGEEKVGGGEGVFMMEEVEGEGYGEGDGEGEGKMVEV